jgi:mono/diheme cytochrome c family protein
MLSKVRAIGFALAMLTSPLVFAQNFNAGATLFANNGCDGCHEYLGATGRDAIRDQIAQRTTPVPGLNYSKSLMALTAALAGTDLDNDATGMDLLLFMFTDAERADLATYIANLPNPTPILTHLPFPGPVFPPTAVGSLRDTDGHGHQ